MNKDENPLIIKIMRYQKTSKLMCLLFTKLQSKFKHTLPNIKSKIYKPTKQIF